MSGSVFRLEMESSVHINAPVEHVWDVFSDPQGWPEWCEVCLSVDCPGRMDWSVGSRLELRLKMAGVGVPFNVTVTESEPGHRVAWASTKMTVTATRTFTFEPDGDGTIMGDHKLFTSPVLPLRLFYPRPIIRNMTESWLRDIKAESERPGHE
ncbi:MAG: SRPBCC family protein [Dehalococcoidia bacterium]